MAYGKAYDLSLTWQIDLHLIAKRQSINRINGDG